ncbi:hypothetical protein BCR39DRAFT_510080 [Naematelia encephala]|uniref:Uncharacterized protein n=1 Tax=Naematelia encephala TaxID=71784 RepID=A0A1Y2BL38_9TREE|nr:hypothetical protein BCR39DRAFT_510080 [Naematelia encephala]
MSDISISKTAINDFLGALPTTLLASTPPTHLPARLPLSLPTPLHTLNILTLLHILTAHLSHPDYVSYFTSSIPQTTPLDLAIRGLMGLYLTSAEDWTANNLLSTSFFSKGGMDETKVVEFFGVEIMRERQHESMPVRVGERWAEGVNVSQGLVRLFKELGERVTARCVGEVVKAGLDEARIVDDPENGAKIWCNQVAESFPLQADIVQLPDHALPSTPLRLLQDLAFRQAQDGDLDVALPHPEKLSNLSPLPLPIAPLVYFGIIDPPDTSSELAGLRAEWKRESVDLFALAETTRGSVKAATVVKLDPQLYEAIQQIRFSSCTALLEGSQSLAGGKEAELKTALDVARVFEALDVAMRRHGLGLDLLPS